MTPEHEDTPEATETRPRAIPTLAAVSMGLAFFGVQSAEGGLGLVRSAQLPPPNDLNSAIAHAVWRTTQDHRALSAATDVGHLLMYLLLFVASSRVFFRPRGGGWLWRQALLGSVLMGAAGAVVDHVLRPGRVAALRAILANPATRFTLPAGAQGTPLDYGSMALTVSLVGSWVTVALFAATFVYATRERTRAWLDA